MVVLLVLAAFTIMIFAPLAAQASVKGRRNTMYLGAAATAYFLFRGKTVPGLIAGAGTYYAYKKYKDAKDNERYYHHSRRWWKHR
jgi:hypothetical protein